MKKLIYFFSLLLISSLVYSQPEIDSGKKKQQAGNHAGAIADFTSAIMQRDKEVQKYLKELDDYEKVPAFQREEKGMEAPKLDPLYATMYYLRGYSYSVTGKNTEAINDFTVAIKIDPKMGAAYRERGKILWSTGKKNEGCTDLGMAGSLKDSIARELFDEKFCWKEAIEAYKDASNKLKLNDYQGALDGIQIAVQLCPDSATYLGVRGRALLGLGKYDLAMRDFDKAVSLSPKSIDAWYGRGVAYYTKGKWQVAFNDLSKAIELDERFADAYLYRAYACEGMEKNQSAIYDYQQAQKYNPASGLAYFKCGLLRSSMNDDKGACNDFRRAANNGYSEAQDYVDKCNQPVKKQKGGK